MRYKARFWYVREIDSLKGQIKNYAGLETHKEFMEVTQVLDPVPQVLSAIPETSDGNCHLSRGPPAGIVVCGAACEVSQRLAWSSMSKITVVNALENALRPNCRLSIKLLSSNLYGATLWCTDEPA
jgi:hypothetical protein